MLRGIFELIAMFFQPTRPPRGASNADAEAEFIKRHGKIFKARDLPPADGRYFVWIRTRGSRQPYSPAIVHGEPIGPKQEQGPKQVLSPEEYGDSLSQLAARYPAPANPEE
jgi:hypothetical protein